MCGQSLMHHQCFVIGELYLYTQVSSNSIQVCVLCCVNYALFNDLLSMHHQSR